MIYQQIKKSSKQGGKLFALLIDPDKTFGKKLERMILEAVVAKVDLFFIGGSLMVADRMNDCIQQIKTICKIPTLLFPGNTLQITNKADGILFLSLISGRNPDLLIGQQVIAAPYLKESNLEIIPTGYMIIDGGAPTSVSYMSNTIPIPHDKNEIAQCTAMAGEMLGLKCLYMDSGSGAKHPISTEMIKAVKQSVDLPLIIGGGLRSIESVTQSARAGADIIVIGTAIEKKLTKLSAFVDAVHQCSESITLKKEKH